MNADLMSAPCLYAHADYRIISVTSDAVIERTRKLAFVSLRRRFKAFSVFHIADNLRADISG